MSDKRRPIIFGEVLFDCFSGGEQVLGGAPFNVAWHLQAFGDEPRLVSRVGADAPGRRIINAMEGWGMQTSSVQIDPQRRTGRVDVALIDDEPRFTIIPDCAYDYIDVDEIQNPKEGDIIYHGTLGLRNAVSRHAFERLTSHAKVSIFLDVNLRSPWWKADEVAGLLKQARWAKLNRDELKQLGPASGDIHRDMVLFQKENDLDLLIVTCGAEGAIVAARDGSHQSAAPPKARPLVDTVGAGDAFSAVFIHGLISEWPLAETLNAAQRFASTVTGLRGATSDDPGFYQAFDG